MPTDETTLADRVRESREAAEELREELLETMWDGNHPLVDYYGPNDPVWEKHKRRCRAENEAELDAYAEAIRAECAAEIAALKADGERLDLVQRAGERRQVWLECYHLNPNSVAAQEEGAYRWTLFGQGLGDMGRGRTARDAIDAARASEPRGRA